MDDLPPHSTYYNYAYEQENQQTIDNVLELGNRQTDRETDRETGRQADKDTITQIQRHRHTERQRQSG